MNKDLAILLKDKTESVAKNFSNPDREKNTNAETFIVDKITALSENTACVTYKKSSGKFALAFFYHVNVAGGQWYYFFPTDSHILGMELFSPAKQKIEAANFDFNF